MTQIPRLKLGYIIIESDRIDEWSRFADDGLGLHVDRLSPDLLVLRVDDRERRIIIQKGSREDVIAVGWETESPEDLTSLSVHLAAQSVDVIAGAAEDAVFRGVDSFFGFRGPKRIAFEFFSGATCTDQTLNSKVSGFVTGKGGLGHIVLFTRRPEALVEDLKRLMGARLSDTITDKLQGLEMEFWFLHLNERHHSLAVAATKGLRVDPLRTSIQHMMIEVETLQDVKDAYQRCKRMGYRIAMGLGQHPNDDGVSFYVVCPSGFEVELGHKPRKIGDDWETKAYRGISTWGHKPEFAPSLGEKLAAAGRAIRSLLRKA